MAVDTATLASILAYRLDDLFLRVASRCVAVVCARITPDQKAAVASMVRHGLGKCTLAIGDGANDVHMLQMANIGVGLRGREGSQAANHSDYVIAEFRHLSRLLLVHGQWSYRRVSLTLLYMFYKNALLVLPQWLFGYFSLFSGQNFYYEWVYQVSIVARNTSKCQVG